MANKMVGHPMFSHYKSPIQKRWGKLKFPKLEDMYNCMRLKENVMFTPFTCLFTLQKTHIVKCCVCNIYIFLFGSWKQSKMKNIELKLILYCIYYKVRMILYILYGQHIFLLHVFVGCRMILTVKSKTNKEII